LSHMRPDVRVRGEWPEAVVLRRGWRAARARPWNDQSTHLAALRLDRGGDRFLDACTEWLWGVGVVQVMSPALAADQTATWRRAGFRDHLHLAVFERDLTDVVEPPLHRVESEEHPDFGVLAAIDDRAFDPVWRVGRAGLEDARAATPLSDVLTVVEDGRTAGFAIVGAMTSVSYLQRVAVEPSRARRGIGRSLLRASMGWARRRGARSMLLNTQPDNAPAAALYHDEGFVALGSRLSVLARHKPGRGADR
ncbi:MAG: GNAT family N-acetyltransferase, partial [Actinomycetota bacterium]